MDFTKIAVPFFILSLLVEYLYGRFRGKQTYRLNDTVNSLSVGVISTAIDLLRLSFAAIVVGALAQWMGVTPWSMDKAWMWVVAFVGWDFLYYWKHRYGHEMRIFWASHAAHHQSEEYNLSTALRQTGTDYIGFVFFIPLFLIGVPAPAIVAVGSLNLIYQFWIHTRHIGQLGFMEWIFTTPSNHRVHHARNPEYLDKNYGGVFIIWDRLFGTYQPEMEDKPCVYGITTGLHSWNPLWANFHVWAEGVKLSWKTRSWRDKLRVWYKGPGWVPADVEAPACPDYRAPKYDPPVDGWTKAYAFVQLWVVVVVSTWAVAIQYDVPRAMGLSFFFWVVFSLWTFGALLENRSFAGKMEIIRVIGTLALAGMIVAGVFGDHAMLGLMGLVYGGLSALALGVQRLRHVPVTPDLTARG